MKKKKLLDVFRNMQNDGVSNMYGFAMVKALKDDRAEMT